MNAIRGPEPPPERWQDAVLAAVLLAIDPTALGGVALRAAPGPVRERWLEVLAELLGPDVPLRRVPANVSEDALLGGLDLSATLRAGRPVTRRGLLAEADGGVLLLAMAERLPPSTAALLGGALESGEVSVYRDGQDRRERSRCAVVALDEGAAPDERPPDALIDRLAFPVELDNVTVAATETPRPGPKDVRRARAALAGVSAGERATEQVCAAAAALGVASMRASLLALRTARAAAALLGSARVDDEAVTLAVRLVLAPKATQVPAAPEEYGEPEAAPPQEPSAQPAPPESGTNEPEQPAAESGEDQGAPSGEGRDEDQVLAAAAAVLPANLLAQLRGSERLRRATGAGGRSGARRADGLRGRAIGVRRGRPGAGGRLHLVETLRAAAPWQRLRGAESGSGPAAAAVRIRPEDFRLVRYQRRRETTTIFVVDASGSTAASRLAEAKGAVELLLDQCYVRRDRVALIAFRGADAQLLLPPTRSLVRARRELAAVPGGGGTPLARGLDAARDLAQEVLRQGGTPVVVLLTDGRANVDRQGIGGRSQAAADALAAGRSLSECGARSLVIDTASAPRELARDLAGVMAAAYLPLPRGGAEGISKAVRAAEAANVKAG